MKQYKTLSSHSGMYTIYDENTKTSLSDIEVCNLLNDFKRELMIKEDLIQQLRNALYTDDHKKFLEYRGKFIRVCEELAEMNMDYKKLSDENEQFKKRIGQLEAKLSIQSDIKLNGWKND